MPAYQPPLQRPVSIHGFNSFQQPLSPLPSLQTNFSPQSPQYSHQNSYHGGSPRGWSHVQSPRSPGVVNQQPKFYQTAPVAAPFAVAPPSSSLYNLGQPQVRI